MKLQDYDVATRFKAKVLSSEPITEPESRAEVREIWIEVENPQFDTKVGQNFGVLAPGRAEIGQQYHFRLYTIADLPQRTDDGCLRICMCVRRCNYIDEYSGEEYPGIASNYLCNLRPDDTLTITGPYGQAFDAPKNPNATLILIGAGTGIAPFRAFVKHTYTHVPEFQGRIWLFHGGQTGLDLLYRNDKKNDFSLYYDRDMFEAFDVLSKRPGWSDASDWGNAMYSRAEELNKLLSSPDTYVYLAGLEKIRDELDDVLAQIVGSEQQWAERKSELEAEGRWIELLY
jgi:ferredoxin--NADP+ reductase